MLLKCPHKWDNQCSKCINKCRSKFLSLTWINKVLCILLCKLQCRFPCNNNHNNLAHLRWTQYLECHPCNRTISMALFFKHSHNKRIYNYCILFVEKESTFLILNSSTHKRNNKSIKWQLYNFEQRWKDLALTSRQSLM